MRWAIRLSELQLPPYTIVAKSTAAIDLAREKALEDALTTDPEWVLFLDSDVIPPIPAYHQLRNRGVDIVSGQYYMDNPDGVHPAMWKLDENGSPAISGYDREGLINVDAVGMGCLLVNREVFESLEPPYFRWTRGFDDHPWDLQHQGERPGISEDFYFCHKALEAGYDIYVDTTVKCIHEKRCYLTDDGLFLQSQLNPSN
jgi:GT2 family glycosyltransferase